MGQALAELVVWYVFGKGQGWDCLLVFSFLLPGKLLLALRRDYDESLLLKC